MNEEERGVIEKFTFEYMDDPKGKGINDYIKNFETLRNSCRSRSSGADPIVVQPLIKKT
jgi:hypothetical protein